MFNSFSKLESTYFRTTQTGTQLWLKANLIGDTPSLSGTVSVSGKAAFDETLTAVTDELTSNPVTSDLGTFTYQWKRGSTVIGTNSSTYKIVQGDIGNKITVTVTAVNCTGSVTSSETAAITKAEQEAPDAPVMAMKNTTMILLDEMSDCEFRRDGGAWQTSALLSGLTHNTAYEFQASRMETETHFASDPSEIT